jgi:hypothetical protein
VPFFSVSPPTRFGESGHGEVFEDALTTSRAAALTPSGIVEQKARLAREGGLVVRLNEKAGLAVHNDLGQIGTTRGNHDSPPRHRFQSRTDTAAMQARHPYHLRTLQKRCRINDCTEEVNVIDGTKVAREPLDARPIRTSAGEDEMHILVKMPQNVEGPNRLPEALVPFDRSQPKQYPRASRHARQLGRFGDSRRHIHGRSDDGDARIRHTETPIALSLGRAESEDAFHSA